ncbi:MAG: hypothetical protein L3K19_04445 [Thermoplasmata archaeon]|nr:hypothetical protein [Thermoplasmata archaeon]
MVQRSLVAVLAALGAILIILGGILGFLLSFGPGRFGGRFGSDGGAFVYGIVAVVLGLIILLCSGYTHYRGVNSSLVGGIVLIVLGAVTWAVVGDWVLVAIGAVLVVLAGLVLAAEVLLGQGRSQGTG